jgi:type I restriction enzyme, S subunit
MEVRKGYTKTEVGIIPDDWEVKELWELGNFKNGINKSSEDFGHGFSFANLMDVFGKSSIESNKNFGLVNSNEAERKLYNLIKGDVLFIRSSVKPSGVGLTCVIESDLPDTVFSGFIIRFRDKGFLTNGYKKHCFYNETFRTNLIGSSTVSANTNINQEALKKLVIAFPPTKVEQTNIATSLSDADSLITNLENLVAKKRNIKQGAMQELLKPKNSWVIKKLGGVADIIRGASPRPIEDPKWFDEQSSIGWVRISDITKSKKYLFTTLQKLSEPGIKNSRYVSSESLIMSICATVGRPILTKINVCIHDGFVVFRKPQLVQEYLYYFLSFIEKEWAKNGQTGSQMNLNTNLIKTTDIPFPKDETEQRYIATILSDMDAEISSLESKLEKYRDIKLGMMQNLLTGKIRLI